MSVKRKIYLSDKLIQLEKFRDPNESFINIYTLYGCDDFNVPNELLVDSFKYSSSIDENDADLNALLGDVQKKNFVGFFILLNAKDQFKQFMDEHLFGELVKLNQNNEKEIHFIVFDLLKNQLQTKRFVNEIDMADQEETVVFVYDHYDLAKLKSYKLSRSKADQLTQSKSQEINNSDDEKQSMKSLAKWALNESFKFCCEASVLINRIVYFFRSLKSLIFFEDGSSLKQRARLFRLAANLLLGIIVTGIVLYNPFFKDYYESFNLKLINYMEVLILFFFYFI